MKVIENQASKDSSKFERILTAIPFRHLIAFGLIVVIAFLVYSNSFYAPFQFDDRPNIVNNPNVQIKSLTWDRLEQLVKNTYKESIWVFSIFTLPSIIILEGLIFARCRTGSQTYLVYRDAP